MGEAQAIWLLCNICGRLLASVGDQSQLPPHKDVLEPTKACPGRWGIPAGPRV